MQLTSTTDLSRFRGGQIEAQSSNGTYRGQIKDLRVTGEGDEATLTVEVDWLAKMEDSGWVKSDPKPYMAGLLIYSASDIGNNRLCLMSPIAGETTVLFPRGGSTLAKSRVRGL